MDKEIDLKIQAGPCISCGEVNYPLSMGGPDICPACDCGWDLKTRLPPMREKIKLLQAEFAKAREEKENLRQYASGLENAQAFLDARVADAEEENKRLRDKIISATCYVNLRKFQEAQSVLEQALKEQDV